LRWADRSSSAAVSRTQFAINLLQMCLQKDARARPSMEELIEHGVFRPLPPLEDEHSLLCSPVSQVHIT